MVWNIGNFFFHLEKKDFFLLLVILDTREKPCLYTSGKGRPSIANIYAGNEHNMWDPNLPLSYFPVFCCFATLGHPVSLTFEAHPGDLDVSNKRCHCS